jgi:hypothetical protein
MRQALTATPRVNDSLRLRDINEPPPEQGSVLVEALPVGRLSIVRPRGGTGSARHMRRYRHCRGASGGTWKTGALTLE